MTQLENEILPGTCSQDVQESLWLKPKWGGRGFDICLRRPSRSQSASSSSGGGVVPFINESLAAFGNRITNSLICDNKRLLRISGKV